MKKKKSKIIQAASILICTTFLFSCSNDAEKSDAQIKVESLSSIGDRDISSVISENVKYTDDDFNSNWKNDTYTSIQLDGANTSFEGDGGVLITNNIITIRTSGVYVISGKLDDGQIIVDAEDKGLVRLILNGVDITSTTNAPIFVKNAEKTVVSLEEGTENVLTDGKKYVYEDSTTDEPNAALFSKDDLTINGSGTLVVNANYDNGISSKDDLKITDGTIQIDAVDDGIMGRDLVAIKEGSFTIKANGDGVKSTNDKDETKGIIVIEGGTFDIDAANDGIQAEASLLIAEGNFSIKAGGGSPNRIARREGNMPKPGDENTNSIDTESESESMKGLKAEIEVAIGGGKFDIDTMDDAVHSNNSITILDGDLKIATGDDGIHADSAIHTKGGKINITKSYEGIESKIVTITDGNIRVIASDDGINIGGGNDGSGMDMQADSEESLLSINGGYIYVNSEGDGLDSNGSIEMTGGAVIVSGPTENNNGALDYDQSFIISGGTLIASGSSGMAMATSEESTQLSILMSYSEKQEAGKIVHLEDSDGNAIMTFTPDKDYQSIMISSPKLKKDTSYVLYSGGKSTGNDTDGLHTDGDYQDGTKVVEFTIVDSVTWLDESGITTPKSSGPGGQGRPGGGFPEGQGPQGNPGEQNPPTGKPGDMFSNVDEETKEQIQTIMEQEREGTITREEAEKKLKELGIEFPGGRE
ncbi:carbohydrate-binding domain-containing protein [Fredinandcohnia quinoae]|uniref:Carbohydrate-binding domain-containing protein n=1 Tax=Fredinandcohnia quinoae TaxID=2918902 RepID=A0AAW5DZ91_9BACI|nr:carbohydrate-binding domain-containing protein [Fredinandcohnia sp. SECRCQ15]MCH1625967.1 carbohydrate-binding domain-containing protein [Fredinandcohnia sp. SECRCQ15]